ncbi:MAG: hypothetical protein AAB855_02345 [Patescibacteria group bacterium]
MRRRRTADESVFGDTNATASLGLMLCIGEVVMIIIVIFVTLFQSLHLKMQEREHPAPARTTSTPAP